MKTTKSVPAKTPHIEPQAKTAPEAIPEQEAEVGVGLPLFLQRSVVTGISQPTDPDELEATQVADRIMRMPASGETPSRRCACGGIAEPDGECAVCRTKRPGLQRQASSHAAPTSVPRHVHATLQSPGQPLDSTTRHDMESRFGHDFGGVRVHTDRDADRAARAVSARAFTNGQKVVFAQGQYAPQTPSGQRLLAHELTHVIQQSYSMGTSLVQRQDAGRTAPATPPAAQSGPPVMVGMDTTNRRIYVSVTLPGHAITEIASYIYGNVEKASELQRLNGVGDFVHGGRNLQLPEGIPSDRFAADRERALTTGTMLRTEGMPSGETGDGQALAYRFNAIGQDFELTEGQMRAMLTGLGVWIYRKADHIHGLAEGGFEVHRDHLNNTNWAVRGISDWLADQSELPTSIWNNALNTSQGILDSLRGVSFNTGDIARGLSIIPEQARQLEQASIALDNAKRQWHVYIEQTISGAEIAVNRLEVVRNVSFGIAAGLAGAVAAPLVFTAAGTALASAGVAGTTATVLSTTAGIGAAAVAGGTVQGSLNVIAPGAQADQSIGRRFATGFQHGSVAGAMGGAGAFIAPAASGIVARGVTQVAGRQFVASTAGRLTVNALTGTGMGVGFGGVGAGAENARALAQGQINQTEYWRRVRMGAIYGGASGLAFSFLPVQGLTRQGNIPFRGDVTPPPRWLMAGPFSPLQANWAPPPGFNNLRLDELPPLMEGYAWIRTTNQGRVQWEPMSLHGPNTQPIRLRWYETPASTSPTANYNLLSGNQLLGSRGTRRLSTDPYEGLPANTGANNTPLPGAPRSERQDFPMPDTAFIEQGGTRRYVRGHNVDYRDTTARTAQIPDSNLDPANFTPEPTWWGGLNGRQRLTARMLTNNPGGQIRQINLYAENPPLTQNGTPIPDRIIFIETTPTGQPLRAWEIPFGPTSPPNGPVNTAANIDANYGIPLTQVPQGLLNLAPQTPAATVGVTSGVGVGVGIGRGQTVNVRESRTR